MASSQSSMSWFVGVLGVASLRRSSGRNDPSTTSSRLKFLVYFGLRTCLNVCVLCMNDEGFVWRNIRSMGIGILSEDFPSFVISELLWPASTELRVSISCF